MTYWVYNGNGAKMFHDNIVFQLYQGKQCIIFYEKYSIIKGFSIYHNKIYDGFGISMEMLHYSMVLDISGKMLHYNLALDISGKMVYLGYQRKCYMII